MQRELQREEMEVRQSGAEERRRSRGIAESMGSTWAAVVARWQWIGFGSTRGIEARAEKRRRLGKPTVLVAGGGEQQQLDKLLRRGRRREEAKQLRGATVQRAEQRGEAGCI
ncbi:hypothetical protein M0R45_001723 [Rubus argutus]|uniref:Uncharacterized protein n=1 Tax=Rubus argutus TaxID=59490 RepID=A0AAW1VJT8_RUBAR